MSGSIRLTGVNGLPLGGSGLRYPGVYAALDFANNVYELGGVSRRALTALPGFTFTRASLAMGYDATGKLTYGPNNLLLYSEQFDNAGWLKTGTASVTANTVTAPDGTLTADTLSLPATSDGMYRTAPLLVGQQYIISMWMRADSAGSLSFTLPSTAPSNVVSVTTSWQRFSYVFTAASTSDGPFIRRSLVGYLSSVYIWGAQLEAVTYQTTPSTYYPTTTAAYYGPRLVYDPVTLASLGILVEEARTNLLLQSQAFDNASWFKGDATVTGNSTPSPDGTTNADTMLANAGTGTTPRLTDTATATVNATVYTASIYAKAGTYSFVQIYIASQSPEWANFTLSGAGTASANGSSTASITALSNGWYRLTMTYTAGGIDRRPLFSLAASGSATRAQTWNPAGTESVIFWQAQLEAGTGASSPIPTTTASVTRAADVARLTGLTLSYPVSLAAGFTRNIGAGISARAATLYIDGNNFTVVGLSSGNSARLDVAQGGVFQAQISGAAVAVGASALVAARVETNNTAFAAQGALAGTDASVTPPAAPTALNIGMLSDAGSEPLNGTISRIRVYKTALSDAQLQSLST